MVKKKKRNKERCNKDTKKDGSAAKRQINRVKRRKTFEGGIKEARRSINEKKEKRDVGKGIRAGSPLYF